MIQFSSHRTAIGVCAAASGVMIGVGWKNRQPALAALGVIAFGASTGAFLMANVEDRNLVRNPEVMNGHFLTGGRASALASAEDVPYLRALMGVPRTPPRGRGDGHRIRR